VDRSKPDPDIVVAALKVAGVKPSEAIMLGDTPYDVIAATEAGIQIVAFECGGWTSAELHGAAAVYADAADLLAHYADSPLAQIGLAHRAQV
jgi:phosphoglycolate phosphatase-like HAD superfamily hydrolase